MHFSPVDHPGMKPPGFRHSLYNALVVPRPIGWISTVSADGVVNLAPFSFSNMVAGDPPSFMYCANGSHREGGPKDSLANIAEVPEFVFNLCSYDLREQMNATSATSPRSVDEMAARRAGGGPGGPGPPAPGGGCAAGAGVRGGPGGAAALRARRRRTTMVIGRVVEIHIDDRVVVDGIVDVRRIRPLARLGYQDYAVIDEPFSMVRPA